MVAHLEHRTGHIAAVGEQVGLRVPLHVAGEEKRGLSKVHPQHDGGVVGIVIIPPGPQNRHHSAAQGKGLVGGGCGGREALGFGVPDKIPEGLGIVFADGGKHLRRGAGVQRAGQAAHMILVGVGTHHIIQRVHALVLQIGDHPAAVLRIAAVDEHCLPPAQQQRGIGLPHVDEVDRQFPVRDRRGGGRAGRIGAGGQEQGQQREQESGQTPLHRVSWAMPRRMRRRDSSRPRSWHSSTAPPGVTALPAAAMRTGHMRVAFLTSRDSARPIRAS